MLISRMEMRSKGFLSTSSSRAWRIASRERNVLTSRGLDISDFDSLRYSLLHNLEAGSRHPAPVGMNMRGWKEEREVGMPLLCPRLQEADASDSAWPAASRPMIYRARIEQVLKRSAIRDQRRRYGKGG